MLNVISKITLAASFSIGLTGAALAGGATSPVAPPPSSAGGVVTTSLSVPSLNVVVTPVSTPGGVTYQVTVNGVVVGVFSNPTLAAYIAAYY
ncbi:hypothetical protein [Roseicyclus sp.]